MDKKFVIKRGYISQGDSSITGSLVVTGGVTGSFSGSFIGDGSGLTDVTASVLNGFDPNESTFTIELIDTLTVDFYAPNDLKINSTTLISGSGTITLEVNNNPYTLTTLINQGDKITVITTTPSVINLNSRYE